ncbi:MAG: hypothetical protein ACI8S6_002895 [Myxococcota bacterium]|jgi:hypothetical protein
MLSNGDTALNNFKGNNWAADTEYWMWGSSGNSTTWPLESFMLELVSPDSIPQSSYNSQTTFKYENKPFPPTSPATDRTVNVNNGKWWSISFASNDSPQIAWLKTRASASPPHNNWYEYSDVSWGTMNGSTIDPQIWLTITQPGTTEPGMGNYPNHVLCFTYAAAGLNSTTDTHPGDQSERNNQYKLKNTVKLKSNQV